MKRMLLPVFLLVVGLAAALPGSAEEPQPGESTKDEVDPNSIQSAWEDYPARDPIVLSVGPGARALDPVAIPMPTCRTDSTWCATVQEIIARDLTFSGFFKVLDKDSFIADMSRETLSDTKWDDWFNVGAKYLIKADIESAGKGNFSLSFRLYDVNLRKVIPVEYQEAAVSAKGVRRATHKFVNEVIRAITGSPGPFGGILVLALKTGHSNKAIYSIGVDGYGLSSRTKGDSIDMLPSLLGGKLLYTSFRPGFPSIYLDGKRITNDERAYRGARMRPDGKVIAVSADTDGGQSDIFLMDLEGKMLENLTNHWADEVSPAWSRGGGKMAFVSNRTGSPQIYIMNGDGSGQRRLTFAGGYNSTPDFGPDGLVVFAGMDEAHSDIFVVDMESNIVRITQDQGNNRDPSWSPDGRHIAFVSDRDGKPHIYISTMDGRYQYRITEKGMTYSTLFWAR
jgi:TolB protein